MGLCGMKMQTNSFIHKKMTVQCKTVGKNQVNNNKNTIHDNTEINKHFHITLSIREMNLLYFKKISFQKSFDEQTHNRTLYA